MTFEVGKEYPTRCGGMAKVVEDDGGSIPLLVRHEDGGECWHREDGRVFNAKRGEEYDLIAPAVEPEAPAPAAKTLRDEFAMAALTGLATLDADCGPNGVAHDAYRYADAMLAARETKGGVE